jgi:hypothetical protein
MAKQIQKNPLPALPPLRVESNLGEEKGAIDYDDLISGRVQVVNTKGDQYYLAPQMTGNFILRVVPKSQTL